MLRNRSLEPAFQSSPFSRRAYLCNIVAVFGCLLAVADAADTEDNKSEVVVVIADVVYVLICIAAKVSIVPLSLWMDFVIVAGGFVVVMVYATCPEIEDQINIGVYAMKC